METVLRVVVIYVFLMIGFRVLGKRELAQMSPLELVLLLIIPELVSQALQREEASLVNGMVAVATLWCLTFGMSVLTHRFPRFEDLVEGIPTLLVERGKYKVDDVNRERITPHELNTAAHKEGLSGLEDIKWAFLESDGKISIVPIED